MKASVGQCACNDTVRLMRELGATKAAEMHDTDASIYPNRWSPAAWVQHIREERRFLFPLLESKDVAVLEADHEVFEHELVVYGRILSLNRLKEHSEMEERLTAEMMRKGKRK